ncbi:MAG: sigma-70 family RNA polymerase sigma factor [Candidatus Poribacteria bacterium]|nr:sigma-70 family RNA polymerase sigma factor [Candidatus Poribacteria bacterium]
MKNDDPKLIQRVLDGDDTAFSVLVKKYQKSVHALAWRKIGDFHIAEDITQDTFLKAYQKLSTLKKPQRFASWLYVIAANHCSTWLRKKRLWTQSLEDTSSVQLEKATYSGYVIEENERMTVETQREVVKKLLAKLQESDRTVITLYYFGGMTYQEISKFLGVSVGAIKARVYRVQQHLRKEEPMIREALENFQITPNLTENIMQEISRLKPIAPSGGKPFVPWVIGVSTLAVVLLMLGVGNHQYLSRFQKPYNFDATSEMTVELIEAPIVLNLESKPDVRTQLGNVNTPNNGNPSHRQPGEVSSSVAEAKSEETDKDYSQWQLPKAAKARFGKGGINAIQFSPDGTQLAVGTDIGVWLYDMEAGREKLLFRGMCQSIAFSPDGRFLANGGGKFPGQELQLWEIAADRKVPIIGGPFVGSVLQFSEDGKTLVSLGNQGDTMSWLDVETGQGYVKEIEAQFSLETPYPKVFALAYDKIAIGWGDGKIQVWNPKTGEALSTLDEQARSVDMSDDPEIFAFMWEGPQILALAFSPDRTRLASGSKDKTVRLWDINTRESMTLQKHTGWPNVLAFSPNGKMLASGSVDKTVQLWDTTTGKPLATLTGHVNGITALAFSPDGSTLTSASADGAIRFWRTETGAPLPLHITGYTASVRAATFSQESATLVSVAFNGEITFWNLKTPQKSTVHTAGDQDWLATLAFSPDGTKFASVRAYGNVIFRPGFNHALWSAGSSIRLTDVSTGIELATLTDIKTPSRLTFSPDGKTVAFDSEAKKIHLWNTETGDELNIPLVDREAHTHNIPRISALAFSPDGTTLVSGTNQGAIQTWNIETGKALAVFAKPADPGNLEYSLEHILALCFSSDGTLLAAGSYELIRIWEVATGNILLSVNPDTGKHDNTWTYRSHPESLVFSPDGAILVTGFVGGAIQLWEVTTGDRIAVLDGHTQQVETLAFSSDGKTLVSTAADGTILLWDWGEVLTGSSKSEE